MKLLKKSLAKVISILLPARLITRRRHFSLWENKGYHISPVHYYWPIPDTRALKDDLWTKHSECIGVDLNERNQLDLLQLFASKFKSEYDNFPWDETSRSFEYYLNNYSLRLLLLLRKKLIKYSQSCFSGF